MTSASTRILLEVPVASVEDAIAAQEGGADRVELNAALALGGLTPSVGMAVEVRRVVVVPFIVMLRPRPGGFCYGKSEFDVLFRDLGNLLAEGAEGVAFGILTATGEIDVKRCKKVVQGLPKDVDAVFHRAFDVTPDPHAALERLVDLGFKRVMTSGQEATATQGISRIAKLVEQAAGRIEVLPAGGIRPNTVAEIVARTGCDQVHASLKEVRFDHSTAARPQVRFGGATVLPEGQYEGTSLDAVREMRRMLG